MKENPVDFRRDHRSVKVGLVQMSCSEQREANFAKAEKWVAECARHGAAMVCLQELSFDPYFCQSEDHARFERAESREGSIATFAKQLARRFQLVLAVGLFERRAPGIYHNSFLLFEQDGSLVGTYRKAHVPDDPSYYEKFYFTPGEQPFPAFETSIGKVGICICWDQWFPEAARLTALSGAEILFFPTAIGWLPEDRENFGESQLSAWQTMMRSHAIANGLFVVAPNRTGTEQGIEFWGNSFICDPYGNVLQSLPAAEEGILVQDLDLSLCETARIHWPFLRDRRTDLYADLTTRWRADHPISNRFSTE